MTLDAGYAKINNDVMAKLGVEPGDFIKITGKRMGAAKVMRSSVSGSGGIAIDGDIRRSAGAGIGDTVTFEKVIPKTAAKITLQPISQSIRLDSRALEQTIQSKFAGRPITKGQIMTFGFQTKLEDPFFSGWGRVLEQKHRIRRLRRFGRLSRGSCDHRLGDDRQLQRQRL